LALIGRAIAAEIEKVFESKVNPGTVFQKARRIQADTNVSEPATPPHHRLRLGTVGTLCERLSAIACDRKDIGAA